MTRVYRIVYDGVCEIWVEAEHNTITKILSATADSRLIGRDISELPAPRYFESKLMAGFMEDSE
jgi:hypothetical protein